MTGVQTCALPISSRRRFLKRSGGATAASVIAWHGMASQSAMAEDPCSENDSYYLECTQSGPDITIVSETDEIEHFDGSVWSKYADRRIVLDTAFIRPLVGAIGVVHHCEVTQRAWFEAKFVTGGGWVTVKLKVLDVTTTVCIDEFGLLHWDPSYDIGADWPLSIGVLGDGGIHIKLVQDALTVNEAWWNKIDEPTFRTAGKIEIDWSAFMYANNKFDFVVKEW